MNQASLKHAWQRSIETRTHGIALVGYIVIALFLGGFGYWAATAPISGAVLAPGFIAAAGQNIQIAHLEGGIVSEILADEGAKVKAGEPILVLDSTKTHNLVNRYVKQLAAFEAKAARLKAERDGLEQMPPADKMTSWGDFDATGIYADQRREFEVGKSRYESQLGIIAQRIVSLNETINGLSSQVEAAGKQLSIVSEEAERKRKLLEKGLTNRSEYTALLRSQAELLGQVGALESQIASSKAQILEAMQQREGLTTSRIKASVAELNEVQASMADMEEQLDTARASLRRTVMRAPADAVVVRRMFNSVGGVIKPGEPVAELLPLGKDMVVEARINPGDIDSVHVGQEANLMFSALNHRTTPQAAATVSYVSADRLIDTGSGQPFYLARLKIADDLPSPISRAELYPGMPVQVFVSEEPRTFFNYLVRPLIDSFAHAFREE